MKKYLFIGAISMLLLAGCTNTEKSTVGGAAAGAAVGALIGNDARSAAIGAGIGGAVGYGASKYEIKKK